jgi:hypothetical protein
MEMERGSLSFSTLSLAAFDWTTGFSPLLLVSKGVRMNAGRRFRGGLLILLILLLDGTKNIGRRRLLCLRL